MTEASKALDAAIDELIENSCRMYTAEPYEKGEWADYVVKSRRTIHALAALRNQPGTPSREEVARIIEPDLFAKYDKEAATGRKAENGRLWADVCYQVLCDHARAKADAILALTPSQSEYDPAFVKSILDADAKPPEATFDNTKDALAYLNAPSHEAPAQEPVADDELAGWARNWHWNDCADDRPVDPSIYFRDMRMLKAFIEFTRRRSALPASHGDMREALEAALPYLDNSDSPGGCNGKHKGCDHCAAIAKVRAALASPTVRVDREAVDKIRCDNCGSSGDVFVLCSGCHSPLASLPADDGAKT
jgi:hypothetical protein